MIVKTPTPKIGKLMH